MPEKNRIEDINKKLTEAAEERKRLLTFVQETYYNVEKLMTQIEYFEKRVRGVESSVRAIEKGRIVGLEGRVEVLEDRLTNVEGKSMKDMEKVDARFDAYGKAALYLDEKLQEREETVPPEGDDHNPYHR